MSNPFTIDHFGTLYFCLFCWSLFSGVSCAFAHIISLNIIMVTARIHKFPNCIVTYTLYFAQARASETIIGREMLGTPTQCHTFVSYDDAGLKTSLN